MDENKIFNTWKWLVVLLVGCNVALIAIIWFRAQAQSVDKLPPPGDAHAPMGRFFEDLSLTPEQTEMFQKASRENRQKIDSLKKLAADVREHFFDGLKSDNSTANTDSLAMVLGNYHKLIELQTYAHFTKLRSMLGDRQKIIFDSIVKNVLKSLPEQPGPRREGPPGRDGMRPPPPPDDRNGPPPPEDRNGPPPPDAR